jgi:hypothetical protein
MSVISHKLD